MSLSIVREGNRQNIMDGSNLVCWFDEQECDEGVCIALGGTLKAESVYIFLDELKALLSVGVSIQLDFSEVQYIAPSYFKAILDGQHAVDQNGQQTIELQNLSQPVIQTIKKLGIGALLRIRKGNA